MQRKPFQIDFSRFYLDLFLPWYLTIASAKGRYLVVAVRAVDLGSSCPVYFCEFLFSFPCLTITTTPYN